MTGTAAVTPRRRQRAVGRGLHRVPRRRRRLGPQAPTPAARARSRPRSRSRPRASTRSSTARADKAGNVEATKSVAFGIDAPEPGFPVIEAFADPARARRRCSCATRPRASTPTAAADLQVGVRGRQRVRPRRHAHVHQAGHLHGEGDRDRRRGRQGDQGGRRSPSPRPGVLPPTVEASADGTSGPAPLRVQLQRDGRRPRRAGGATCTTAGTSATAARRSRATRATPTCEKGTYTAKVTVSDASGAHGHQDADDRRHRPARQRRAERRGAARCRAAARRRWRCS